MIILSLIVFISFLFLVFILLVKIYQFSFWKNLIDSEAFYKSDNFFNFILNKIKKISKKTLILIIRYLKFFLFQTIVIAIKVKNKVGFILYKIKNKIEKINVQENKGSVSVYLQDMSNYKKDDDKKN